MKLASAIREFVDYSQALGKVYRTESYQLKAFLKLTGDIELCKLTPDHVEKHLRGKGGPVTTAWLSRYTTLNTFFRYAISRGYMQMSLLPISVPKMPARFLPYLYSVEEIRRLVGISDSCYRPIAILSPPTVRTLILLLYGTGLRLGETTKLKLRDVDLKEGVLTIRQTKFFKSRLVPIGSDLLRVLRLYSERHWSGKAHTPDSPFFCTRKGTPMTVDHAHHMFQWLRTEAGVLLFDGGRFQPRLHDFRHTFAVTRLVTWYREGKDVQRLLPHLSTYLGHIHIGSTARYLNMTKELLHEASRCFERYALAEANNG